jgi:hypothetical protein
LFLTFSNVSSWKIELFISTQSVLNGYSNGYSSFIIAPNRLPLPGHCTIYPLKGIADVTYFNISCFDWTDLDGQIIRYEFYGKILIFTVFLVFDFIFFTIIH